MRALLTALSLGLAACSGRAAPAELPPGAAGSPSARAGERHDVTRALREDPPAPGDPARAAWIGLSDQPDAELPACHAPPDAGAPAPPAEPHHHHVHP